MRYDYIIIGAGSAGCVLANRLSEDTSKKILLLEAGGPDNSFWMKMPAGIVKLFMSPRYNWSYFTEPEAQLDNRTIYFPQGRVLGGSSSVNGLIYLRGHQSDFDNWAALGNAGWDYHHVLPYFKKSESTALGTDEYHGRMGPLGVANLAYETPFAEAFIKAGQALGYSYNPDFNGAKQEGFGRFPITQRNNQRCSTANAFLHPALERPNLTLKMNVTVLRLLLSGKRAHGLEYLENDQIKRINTDGEIIISAGAINTPKLLMLSGIGPAEHLHQMAINTLHELPGVGENFQDHLNVPVIFETPSTKTLDMGYIGKGWAGLQYLLHRSGPACSNGVEAGAFIRSEPALACPDIQINFQGFNLARNLPGNIMNVSRAPGIGCQVCVTHPKSRGRVRLRSADHKAHPILAPHYLSDENDLYKLIQAVQFVQAIFAEDPLKRYITQPIIPTPESGTEADLIEYIRQFSKTVYHAAGTCQMGHGDMAVVDHTLRIHGLDGVRIVDASIMPTIVGANTNAATIMIAEKAADMIKG